jgi:glycine cleavage system H protein
LSDYDIPDDCRYTQEDEWVRREGDRMVVGVTDYAQQELGDIVYVELPSAGTEVVKGETFGVIESVKAVADLYAPVSGTVAEANDALADQPEVVNEDCYGDGWILALEGVDASDLDELMDAEAYRRYITDRKE